ncbi:MAG: flagellar motor protein MotA [Rhodobacteraceae bacterium]|nr:flagellar motor protein MotA [Paracoccaceae bacterium]QEW19742.1 Biopolymer transport protein ExbB [Marinibacterium anthonyi]
MPALQTLGNGGPIIIVLALLSLLSLTVIVVKVIDLWPATSGRDRRDRAIRQWERGEKTEALTAARAGTAPADRMLVAAMEDLDAGRSPARIEADLQRRGNEEVAHMNRLIRLLEIIAMIAPLLGLLGTVLGMIQSFQELEMAEGSANASVLAGGIWQALLTTAAGLLVAIPAAVASGLFAARIDRAALAIESAVGRLLSLDEPGG